MTPKITLTCRLAVSGHTFLPGVADAPASRPSAEVQELVQSAAKQILDAINEGLDWARFDSNSRQYPTAKEKTRLVVISSLAPGTDQWVSQVAINSGHEIASILPGRRAEYDAVLQMQSSTSDFHALADQARCVALVELDHPLPTDPQQEGQRREAYWTANDVVLQNADFLLAVWDETRTGHRGGTVDMIQRAQQVCIPIFVIDPNSGEISIVEPNRNRFRGAASQIRTRIAQLVRNEIRLIVPPQDPAIDPEPASTHHPSADEEHQRENEHLEEFFLETPVKAGFVVGPSGEKRFVGGRGWGWVAFASIWNFIDGLWSVAKRPCPHPTSFPMLSHQQTRFHQRYAEIDRLAIHYSSLHRASLAALYSLGVIAVGAAAWFGLLSARETALHECAAAHAPASATDKDSHVAEVRPLWQSPATFCVVELSCLMVMALVYLANSSGEWHRRSTDYRLLFERLRHRYALSLLGRANWIHAYEPLPPQYSSSSGRMGWVDRVFRALIREDVLSVGNRAFGDNGGEYVQQCRNYYQCDYLWGQIDYHRRNATKLHRQHRAVEWLAVLAFLATMACCAAHLKIHSDLLALVGISLPALVAACHGIAAQFHLQRVLARSEAMEKHLHAHYDRLHERPESIRSDELARRIEPIVELMQREADDWRIVFRLLNVPTPG